VYEMSTVVFDIPYNEFTICNALMHLPCREIVLVDMENLGRLVTIIFSDWLKIFK